MAGISLENIRNIGVYNHICRFQADTYNWHFSKDLVEEFISLSKNEEVYNLFKLLVSLIKLKIYFAAAYFYDLDYEFIKNSYELDEEWCHNIKSNNIKNLSNEDVFNIIIRSLDEKDMTAINCAKFNLIRKIYENKLY